MWSMDERNRPENREVASEWRRAGYEDSHDGAPLPTFAEMKEMANDDGEGFTTRDYSEFVAGYADFEEAERR